MIISEAIDDYHRYTCLKFKPRSDEKNFVKMVNGNGCYSYVGMIGGGQHLSLAYGCRDVSNPKRVRDKSRTYRK